MKESYNIPSVYKIFTIRKTAHTRLERLSCNNKRNKLIDRFETTIE